MRETKKVCSRWGNVDQGFGTRLKKKDHFGNIFYVVQRVNQLKAESNTFLCHKVDKPKCKIIKILF